MIARPSTVMCAAHGVSAVRRRRRRPRSSISFSPSVSVSSRCISGSPRAWLRRSRACARRAARVLRRRGYKAASDRPWSPIGRSSSSRCNAFSKKRREKVLACWASSITASNAKIMPHWRRLRTCSCSASGASAAFSFARLLRVAASTSSLANRSSVASAARQASGLPVYECECRKPRAVSSLIEGCEDFIARQHERQRQIAAADAFRQTQEVRPDAGLLAGEEGAGAAAADGDFIGDQMHAVLVAQCAQTGEIRRVVHGHAGRALHQRLDDDGGDLRGACFEQRANVDRARGARRRRRFRLVARGARRATPRRARGGSADRRRP